jgi:hypothetical protein
MLRYELFGLWLSGTVVLLLMTISDFAFKGPVKPPQHKETQS